MKHTLFGGKDEIGGNKILLEHHNTKIFLDYGMSFSQYKKFYSEFLNPRKVNGLQDFFKMGLLPDIPGLYREDYLRHMGRPAEKRSIDAVLLSHAHADHVQYIHFLRPDIPIYCTKETHMILKVLVDTSTTPFTDFISVVQDFSTYINRQGKVSRVTRRNKDYVQLRKFVEMEEGQTYQIGDFSIEMNPLDHSIPGACGYFLHTDEGSIVYTGDIRFHGSRKNSSKRFIQKAAEIKPKWMLCEGTRIDSVQRDSEESVKENISKYISNAPNLVLIEHPIRDFDRISSIYRATVENDRTFVVNTKLAYLIKEFGDLSPIDLQKVKVFIPPRSWGLILKENPVEKILLEDYRKWEKEMLSWDNKITTLEIKKNPKKYVLSMNAWELNNLIDLEPENAVWIKSTVKPFNDEMIFDEQRKKNWLKHFNIEEFHAHASGHASGDEIKQMIKEINPEIVIPIHTEHSDLY